MGKGKPELFAREATGLVREIGFTLGVIVILSHVIGLGWQQRAFSFAGPRPMPNDLLPLGLPAMFWAFLAGGIVVLITGYAVGYVTISRVIHPFVGYNAGWLMFLAEAFSYGLIGVAVFEAIMIFYNIALAPTVIAYDATLLFVGGLVIVWVFAIIALFGVKLYGRLMEAMFYIPAVITVAFFAMWIAGAMDPSATGPLAKGVEDVMGAPPSTFVTLALNTGMADNMAGFFDAFSYALGGAFWAYMGWYATTFIAGEVKEANKKLPMVVMSAGFIIMVVYLLATSLSAISVLNVGVRTVVTDGVEHQWGFYQSYGWLSYGISEETFNAVVAPAIPNFQNAWSTGIASLIARGLDLGWLSWLIALAGVFWLANDIPPFLLVASRTFFAMSFDRMLPESFAYVSERWHAPVWSLIITAVAGVFGCIAESNVAGLKTYFAFAGVIGTDIFDATFLTLFCVSCLLLPLERKEIYDRAAVKHSVGTIVGLGFFATVGSAFCLYIFIKESPYLWSFFTSAAEVDALWSAGGFFGCILIGVLLYVYHMYRNTTKGVDMRTLYLSIPPE